MGKWRGGVSTFTLGNPIDAYNSCRTDTRVPRFKQLIYSYSEYHFSTFPAVSTNQAHCFPLCPPKSGTMG
ncbi:hypothetical protein Y032_0608g606 [Ancylostoma ceylanicum]|uniref:Uncharacterized protein n=1 Tax=Ancylostoma ceylanicum TaxID=53326 RepID=A0A016WLQ5_9BILA|nr:hypothetical protein Y032_0608g606 [Ancylostoma ceylanicum]